MQKTLIIGSCTVDIVIPTPHLPQSTEDINSGEHRFSLGGCAYNVSQIFQLLDLTYLHGVTIGSGIYGDYVRKELTRRNIPIFRNSEQQHGACLCLVEKNGERSFIAYHGIEYKFDRSWFKDVDLSDFNQAFLCGLELEEDTGPEIVAFLEEHSFANIYFAPGPRLCTIESSLLQRLLALKPIIHLNQQEIGDYTGIADPYQAAQELYKKNHNDVIVTLGKDGSLVYDGQDSLFAEGLKVTVKDTIGAGDCHLGTYMAYRQLGLSKQEALKKANSFAAAVVAQTGPSLSKETIKALL